MSSTISGDLSVLVPTDTPFHGTGKIETQESFYLTRSSGIAKLETTYASVPLTVQAANLVTVASTANALTVSGQTGFSASAITGNASLTASSSTGAVNVAAGSAGTVLVSGQKLQLGPTAGTTTGINLQTDAAASANYAQLAMSATGVHISTKQDVSLTSTKTNGQVSLETGALASNTHAKLRVFHDAVNSENGMIELATASGGAQSRLMLTKDTADLVASAVTLGKVGGTVNVAGDLTVSGTQTVLNSTNVSISDRIMHIGVMPSATSDSGFIFERYPTDVTAQVPLASTTLLTSSLEKAQSITLTSVAGMTVGQLLRVVGASTEHVRISNIVGNTVTVSPALVAAFTSGVPVTAYGKRASALFFDESASEFAVGYTTATPTDTMIQINPGQYSNLRVNTLFAEAAISSPSFKTVVVNVPANASIGAAVLIDASLRTRGSFLLVIESQDADGATAVISISKGQSALNGGATAVLTSSPATPGKDEAIRVVFGINATGPSLYHSPLRTGAPSTPLTYTCRIIGV
jgi:hypothetical protein